MDEKEDEESKVADLIKLYLILGKTEVNLSRLVNVVRKIYFIMKLCNCLIIVKEEQHGRLKTSCYGTNMNQNATQKIMMSFNSIFFRAFLLIFVNVLKIFFPSSISHISCSPFPILPVPSPNHITSKTPITPSWLPLSNFPLVQTRLV